MTVRPAGVWRRRASDRSGATLPELAVAAALLLAATAMAGGSVLAPITTFGRIAVVDEDAHQLMLALDSVAMLVRAARPTIDGPGVISLEHIGQVATLRLRTPGSDGHGEATLIMTDRLELLSSGNVRQLPAGTLVDGLDPSRSRIELLDTNGAVVGDVGAPVASAHAVTAVRVVVHRSGHEASRTVHLRLERPLGAVRG